MGADLDRVPFSGIIRIRDMMYSVANPYRLDQGDVSFDAPDTVKEAMARAIAENRSHYAQTTGIPRLLELLVEKLRSRNSIPVGSADEVMVTTGGIHGVYIACMALLEPGDEVIVPDPEWPPTVGNILCARAVPVGCPLREELGWRWDLDELASKVTARTRAIYVNSPNNPSGGMLTRDDLQHIAELAETRNLWVISDEAYEDVAFDVPQVSIASLSGVYERCIPIYTFSKTYAMTGLRLGYVAARDAKLRERMKKVLFYTAGNIPTVVQYGGIGALEGSQACVEDFRTELKARRDLFYTGIAEAAAGVLDGAPPSGAFYAFMRINPAWQPPADSTHHSISWAMTEHLIARARVGCVPGVDFGPASEGYVRFCFARERAELSGALESMMTVFRGSAASAR
jgi:aspartate aminotransferase